MVRRFTTKSVIVVCSGVSSSSSGEISSPKLVTSRCIIGNPSDQHSGRTKLSRPKQPHCPKDSTCGRCFRNTHKTAECRHQIVCLRCVCVGHMATRCLVEMGSPRYKRIHIRTKRVGVREESIEQFEVREMG